MGDQTSCCAKPGKLDEPELNRFYPKNNGLSQEEQMLFHRMLVQESYDRMNPYYHNPYHYPPQYQQRYSEDYRQSLPQHMNNNGGVMMPQGQTHYGPTALLGAALKYGYEQFEFKQKIESQLNSQNNKKENHRKKLDDNHDGEVNQNSFLNPESVDNFPSQVSIENERFQDQREKNEFQTLKKKTIKKVSDSFLNLSEKQISYVPYIHKIAMTLRDEERKCIQIIQTHSSKCSVKSKSTEKSVMGGYSELRTRPTKLFDAFFWDCNGRHDNALILLSQLENEVDKQDYHLLFLISQKRGQICYFKNDILQAVKNFEASLEHLNKGAKSKGSEMESEGALKEVFSLLSRCYRDLELHNLANKFEKYYHELRVSTSHQRS